MTRFRIIGPGDGPPVDNGFAAAANAAITEAVGQRAVLGMLIYETADGGIGRLPILAGIAAQRGLITIMDEMWDGEGEGSEFEK